MFLMRVEDLKAELKKLLGKKRGRTKTVVSTLDHEVGWRLQKLASLWGVPQGAIVEILIRETVAQFRLPYDTFGRESMWNTSAIEGGMEIQGSDGDGAVETLPIGEGLTSSDESMLMPGSGAGEGGGKPPAPSPRAAGGKGRPAGSAKDRKAS